MTASHAVRPAKRRYNPINTRSRCYTGTASIFILAALVAVGAALDIDWTPFTTALTGMVPVLTLLVAGVIVAVITIAVLFKAVPWVAKLVTKFMH